MRHLQSSIAVNGLLALGVCVLTASALWPALSGGFIFDDYPVFAENAAVRVSGWHLEAWHALWAWSEANIQRPLTMYSFALNYAFGGSEFSFKATNLCIHLFNVLLVLSLTRRLLDRCWLGDSPSSSQLSYWACGIAIAWAIHPLQISAVMYVVQRMELMGFTFTLLSLLAYWHARECQMHGQHAWPWLLLYGILIVVGYGTKETIVLVPGYTLLLELTIFRFRTQQPTFERAWKLCYGIGFGLAAIAVVTYLAPHYTSPAYYVGRDFNAWQRELTQLRVLCKYLGWIFLPLPSQLHFYYDNYQASTGLLHPITTLLSGLFLFGLLASAVTLLRRRPLIALGIGWFFVAHALTSGPLPLELIFEHRNYPALYGIALAVADIIWISSQRMHSRLPVALACVFMINLCFLATMRAATWGSPLQLAISLAQANPGSSRAALDLARRYVAMSGNDPNSSLYKMGIKELERAVPLTGAHALPEEALLIQAALHPGRDPSPWWTSLQQKLQTESLSFENYRVLNSLMEQRLGSNTGIDAKQLAKAYEIAIARNPDRISLHVQYAELAARALNNPNLAIEQWRQVVIHEKGAASYVLPLANYLINNHRTDEALAVLDEALHMQPTLRSDSVLMTLQAKLQATRTARE